MTQRQISKLFEEYRCFQAGLAILRICSEQLSQNRGMDYNIKYTRLEKNIAVINQLSALLLNDERYVIQKHLAEGLPWSGISEMIYADKESDLPYDKRSLQRTQARALERIRVFIERHFQDALYYLADESS